MNIKTERVMKDYLYNLYVSMTTLDVIYLITTLVLISSFFEKLFNIDFIGRRIMRYLWTTIKFLAKWFVMPFVPKWKEFQPTWELVKKFAYNSTEVETQLVELLSHKQERTNQINLILEGSKKQGESLSNITEQLESVVKELQFNGGESVKDSVANIQSMIKEILYDKTLVKAILDIDDKLDDRMIFRTSAKGTCLFISSAFLKYFGWVDSDMLGDNWMFCIDDRDAAIVETKWALATRNKTRYYNKQRIKDSVGVSHYCLVVAYPILIGDELLGFRGVVEVLDDDEVRIKKLPPLKIHDTEG